ncbi:PREDICTED: DEMETER-like protein 3 [Camelina sativa]|uniref:DEMETER-like protein 3 n=1 Tax=Camelina sativa TaxID=90675 RepID=A0ABM0TWG0_CAMSA|nr:PREDICTED: DEMETER-like protein 3 [Camelina sativa]XP_010432470.1 PREDICTED: DEMETER-like protein 3 [Camelina sativa]XP_010432471.1 PREDICTED: DEMETER-like protein 3 [Camelina sativa]
MEIVPKTPEKPKLLFTKFYVRRKHLDTPQDIISGSVISPLELDPPLHKQELHEQDNSQSTDQKEEKKKTSDEEPERNCHESDIFQGDDDSQHVSGKRKRNNSKETQKKMRYHRPRIMEEGKKPRNPTTTRLRTISKKKGKKKDNNNASEDEVIIAEPPTPQKQSRSKTEKPKKRNVARTLNFNLLSCLELERICGPTFPKGRKRMTPARRSDFHCLISPYTFPLPIWKKQSRRSNRRKNLVRWFAIAFSLELQEPEETLPLVSRHLSQADVPLHIEDTTSNAALKMDSKSNNSTKDTVEPLILQSNHQKDNAVSPISEVPLQIKDSPMRQVSCVVPKKSKKITKNIVGNLIQQITYQKDHGLPSLADVPLHIEDTLMRSASDVPVEREKTKDIAKLIKEMRRLNINRRVTTTLIESGKKLVTAKVKLDPETIKEWELLMVNSKSHADKKTNAEWEQKRENFKISNIDLFIHRMHLLQGNRKFKQWKGSVVDSVVGVFLTQNVSDYLSSNAFMSVAAKFPANARECLDPLAYYIEEPEDVNDSILADQEPTHIGNDDAKNSQFITLSKDSIPEVEEHEKSAKRKNKKTGIMEDAIVDWNTIRKKYTKEGSRQKMHMDSVNWNDVRLSGEKVFQNIIRQRGQFKILSGRILKFLRDEVRQNGTIDLEWLRDAPSDLVKRYLLEIEGIGLKSAECVRLLGIKHSAFPVDTNVGRIAVRLGWVPLEPLPDGIQMHQLSQYPSMDSIQQYLWPRLCKLPQETLYELHYQMITFGKVFCTKALPNCNACPMKSECKYFASAYVSSKVLLEGPEEKTHDEPDTFKHACSQDVDVNMTSNINLIEECASPRCSEQDICCKPLVEFPSSPRPEIPELVDIEDFPWRNTYQPYARIPEIDIDLDALKKNVEDALVEGGKILSSSDEEISKAIVLLTPENACIPIKPPRKMKYYDRLRTEHVVYVLPDNHKLLHDFERRELDDPSPYLLAIWQPGETSNSFTQPKKKCDFDGSELCKKKTCSYCWAIREQSSNTSRGTILIPCRTAMRAGFPLNGTYFQTNEVFADHETSLEPVVFPREWCDGLEKRAMYCGSSVSSIFRLLDTRRIQLCFWTGFLCMRAFDRKKRMPQELVRRLHTPPVERGPKYMHDDDI